MVTTALCTAVLATGPAAANNWIGTIGSWFVLENWSTGSVPTVDDEVSISNGGTAEITAGQNASTLKAEIADGNVTVTGSGRFGVTGLLEMGSGGASAISVSSGGSVLVGNAEIRNSTISLSGAGTSFQATGYLYLGNSIIVVSEGAGLDAGTTTLDNSTVTVTGAGAQLVNTTSLTIGNSGTGTLTITNGATARNVTGAIGSNVGSSGEVIVTGAGSTWTNTGNIQVGRSGTGSLTISAGAKATSMVSAIADNAGSIGTATVSGTGSKWTNATTYVGNNGTGTLVLSDGGRIENTTGLIGAAATGRGEATLSGAGTTWTNTNVLSVGGSGTATLIVKDGAEVEVVGAPGILVAEQSVSTGTLIVGGRENAAAEAAGTVTTGTIGFGLGTGKMVLNHTDNNYILGAAISGAGSIVQKAGTTTLTGDSSSFTGTTTVSGGKLVVGNGTSGALWGTINVGSGATLGGTGNLGATVIAAGGTHAPGNSIGTQTVNGNYVNHGTLLIEVDPAGSDKLVVNGTVDITNARLDLQLAKSGWDLNSPYVHTIIANDGVDAVTGAFGEASSAHLFLDTTLNYAAGDGNDVALTIARNGVSFASLAANAAQSEVAQAIENLGSGELFDAIVALGDADLVQQSFEALSGQIHGSAGTTLVANGKMLGQTANTRMQGSTEPAGGGATPVLAYGPGGPELVAPDTKLGVVWSSGFGARGSLEGNTAGSTLDTGSAGIAAGMDGQFGDWRLGALAGYSNSSFNAKDGNSTGGSNNYSLGLYGGTEWGDVAFRSSLAYTWHDLSTQRSVTVGGFTDQLSARYGAHAVQASGELSYGFDVTNAARIEPFANLTHVRMATDGYSESGGAAALTNAASVTHTTFTTLGVRASQKFAVGTVLATVNGMVGWEHGMGDLTPKNTSSFAGGSTFTATGTQAAADTALVSAGVDLNLSEAATIGFTYDGRFAKGNYNNGVTAKVKILF